MKLTYIVNKELDKKFVNLASPVIKKNFDLFYSNNSNILNETAKLYQNSWNKINDNFSTLVENYTEHKWYYPEYFCVVSVNVTGVSN